MNIKTNLYCALLGRFLVVLSVFWLTRLLFYFYNADSLGEVATGHLWSLMLAGLRFDLSAMLYFNALYIVLRLLPFDFVAGKRYTAVTDWVFYVTNGLMLSINLADTVFYQYGGARLRFAALADMLNDPEIVSIFFSYFPGFWQAYIGGAALIVAVLWLCSRIKTVDGGGLVTLKSRPATYAVRAAILLAVAALAFVGMRGRLGDGRPLSIGDAAWGTDRSSEINIVLNSPFCVLRSISGANVIEPIVFYAPEQLRRLRSSVHNIDADSIAGGLTRKNVMVITVESLGQIWLDSLNIVKDDPKRGLMPFLDSIAARSLVCTRMTATGRRSIEGVNAVYGGFPSYEPFIYMLSPYNANVVDAAARLLKREGYSTVFYFGGNHGSYSIDQFVYAMGVDRVLDRHSYDNDADYDGNWGIFDHAMAEFAVKDLSENVAEPFYAGWFTISNHGPYTVPSYWQPDGYKNKEEGMERAVEYTDRALRHFFNEAKRQPWYDNTIFVITGDHGCRDLKGTKYNNAYIMYQIPFIVYTPDGSIAPRRIDDRVMSHIDINATILGLLDYRKPYVSLGTDLLNDTVPHYAVNFVNNQFQVLDTRYLVQLSADAKSVIAVYDIENDQELSSPLSTCEVDSMISYCRLFLQDYTDRIINNRMSIENE